MINPMMYRVFLQEEEEGFRFSSVEILAWSYTDPNYKPDIAEQLRRTNSRIAVEVKSLDSEHWLVDESLVFHSPQESRESAYEIAKQRALDLTQKLTRKKGVPYVFIDVSSKGDKEEATKLSRIIHNVSIAEACPRAVSID